MTKHLPEWLEDLEHLCAEYNLGCTVHHDQIIHINPSQEYHE
jgi:hypothetical protein